MNDAWKDLLDRHPDIDPGRLLAYLEDRLTDRERHEVEIRMAESDFMSEAMEGLAQVKDPGRLSPIVGELNRGLRKRIRSEVFERRRGPAGFPGWLIVATLLIVALAVLGYIVYRMYTTD